LQPDQKINGLPGISEDNIFLRNKVAEIARGFTPNFS